MECSHLSAETSTAVPKVLRSFHGRSHYPDSRFRGRNRLSLVIFPPRSDRGRGVWGEGAFVPPADVMRTILTPIFLTTTILTTTEDAVR